VADHTDIVNDYASPLPKRTIIIYPAQNAGDRNNFGDWLDEVLVHEYTHILQMDMQSGIPAGFNSLFGRIFLPNIFQPLNQIEGLAVYSETRYTGFGRNRSALTEGMLRSAVDERKWVPLDRVGVASPCWPRDASYIYGGKFYEYLADKYGPKKLALYQRKHSNLVIPFMQNMPAKSVFGKSFSDLWTQWRSDAFKRYSAQAESLKGQGLTDFRHLTDDGFDKTFLSSSPDGKSLAYADRNSHRRSSLKLYDIGSGKYRTIDQGIFLGSMQFSSDGRYLAYGKMEYSGFGENLYGDIYIYDTVNRKTERITRCLRARDPAFSRDGKMLYFVASSMDQNALAVLDLKTKQVESLTELDESQLFSHPSVSPNGEKIALAVWQDGGYQDIYLYDIAKKEWRALMADKAQDITPAWSGDGKYLYFASDRSGVWNIFKYDLQTAAMSRVTNVIGGAFNPAVCDANVYFLSLSSRGFDIVVTEISDSICFTNTAYIDTTSFVEKATDSVNYPSVKYRPFKTLLPFFWFPMASIDEKGGALGVALLGADDLMAKSYTAVFVPSFNSQRFYYDIAYSDADRSLNYNFRISDNTTAEDVGSGNTDVAYYQRQQSQSLQLYLPLTRSGHVISAAAAYCHTNYTGLNNEIFAINPYWNGHLARLQMNLGFSNAQKYGFSISPERGRSVSLESRFYRKYLGGELNQSWQGLSWTEYLPLPFRHQMLMGKIMAGVWGQGVYVNEDIPEMRPRGTTEDIDGRYRTLLTAEYRFPLLYVERGFSTWPFYLKNVSGALLMDVGTASNNYKHLSYNDSHRCLGAEITSQWLFSYAAPFKIILGFYHLPEEKESHIALKMGTDILW
jgi:Tol biopolymer transport system component